MNRTEKIERLNELKMRRYVIYLILIIAVILFVLFIGCGFINELLCNFKTGINCTLDSFERFMKSGIMMTAIVLSPFAVIFIVCYVYMETKKCIECIKDQNNEIRDLENELKE